MTSLVFCRASACWLWICFASCIQAIFRLSTYLLWKIGMLKRTRTQNNILNVFSSRKKKETITTKENDTMTALFFQWMEQNVKKKLYIPCIYIYSFLFWNHEMEAMKSTESSHLNHPIQLLTVGHLVTGNGHDPNESNEQYKISSFFFCSISICVLFWFCHSHR